MSIQYLMNVLAKLKQAKQLLSGVKLTREQLSDGSFIEYTSLKTGADVVLLDDAGNSSLLADGSYKAKSGLQFSIASGLFANVDSSKVQTKEDKPVLQAQSATEEPTVIVETAASGSTSGDTASATTEVKQADIVPAETPAQEAANTALTLDAIGSLIDKKLLPVWDAVNALANLTTSYPTFLNAVEEMAVTVTKLSAAPNGSPIEQELNPYRKPVPVDVKLSKAFRITQALNK